jgi:heterodisulfide reductase subunit C
MTSVRAETQPLQGIGRKTRYAACVCWDAMANVVLLPPGEGGPAPGTPLAVEVRRLSGVEAARCYQCGKCSAGCPMASEMKLKTHQILRRVQLDRRDVLAEESIWLCLGCETCTWLCPNGLDPAGVLDALRELALADRKDGAPRRIGKFHETFLGAIRKHGRIFEIGLIAAYKLKTGALFDDVLSAPGMLRRGKLALAPQHVSAEALAEVRRIFKACEEAAPPAPPEDGQDGEGRAEDEEEP